MVLTRETCVCSVAPASRNDTADDSDDADDALYDLAQASESHDGAATYSMATMQRAESNGPSTNTSGAPSELAVYNAGEDVQEDVEDNATYSMATMQRPASLNTAEATYSMATMQRPKNVASEDHGTASIRDNDDNDDDNNSAL